MGTSRVILMGDPACFTIRRGANPHTRKWLGFKKQVDRKKAVAQWHRRVAVFRKYEIQIQVIPPHPELPGLVFPANAGFTPRAEKPMPLQQRDFVLTNLNEARSLEQKVYADFLSSLGIRLHRVKRQFEGEADLISWGERYLFTYGRIERQRFVPRLGLPPWKRIYGFRSDGAVLPELKAWIPLERVLKIELAQESFYHGDTVFASFGPKREYLLAYRGGFQLGGRKLLEGDPKVLWLSEESARRLR